MKKKRNCCLFFCLFFFALQAQPGRDETLANSYLQNGEFDKSGRICIRVYGKE